MNQRALSKVTIKYLYEYDRQGIYQGNYPHITDLKTEKNVVPAAASMQEIMTTIREDVLERMRTMCNEREIAVNRTLNNSVSFKCL